MYSIRFLFFAFLLFSTDIVVGQCSLRGKITEDNGEAVISAVVVLKSNPANGTQSDFDGNFVLDIKTEGIAVIKISSLGYQSIEDTINCTQEGVVIRNYILRSADVKMTEVVVAAKAVRANDTYIENFKKRSANALDYISAETMKKTGDASVVAAISRVSGVSTNGGFFTVRGIGDRYVKTTMNGLRIPTLDPFTNNIKLDLFPSSMVDNIIITKSTSADLPGDWTGAYISIETKDYPEKLSVSADVSSGFNIQNVFRTGISSDRSPTDFLGFDNGFREQDHNSYIKPNPTPSQYEEFVGLGLGDFYRSLGVAGDWVAGTASGETLFKLGLVELGLLPRGLINDPVAYTQAKTSYLTGPYRSQAFQKINQAAAQSGQTFSNNWDVRNRTIMPNYSISFSVGNQVKLFKRPLGFLFAVRYSSSIQYDGISVLNREDVYTDTTGERIRLPTSLTQQRIARETNGWSALATLSYKFNPNNSISVLFMPNIMGVNNVRDAIDTADNIFLKFNKSQFYEHRRQLISQIKTEHYFPTSKVKMEFVAGYTQGVSNAPDFKNINYNQDRGTGVFQIGGGGSSNIQRYYRYLRDDIADGRISWDVPVGAKAGLVRKIKLGMSYQYNTKSFDQYVYDLFMHPTYQNFSNPDINQYLALQNFGISQFVDQGIEQSKMNVWYIENSDPANKTRGESHTGGVFGLIDFAIVPRVRINSGLRVEYANIYTDVTRYDSLGYAPNDIRRLSFSLLPNPGQLREFNYLPSMNLIFKLKDDEEAPINLRLGYSYNVARPTIRELSETFIYDFELRSNVLGNASLKSVKIHNVDLRFESYFKGKHDISLSLFYKHFTNHIELLNYEFFTWRNVDESRVFGVEIEGKTTLCKGLELRLNASYINSLSKVIDYRVGEGFQDLIPVDTVSRPMFGQAPFVVNGILSYTHEKSGFSATASYNVQGPRLIIAGISTGGRPDVYEMPRHLLDVKLSQTIKKCFTVSLTGRNLVNSPIRRTFRYQGDWLMDFDRLTVGQELVLGLSYKF